jgi:hypothetical protein
VEVDGEIEQLGFGAFDESAGVGESGRGSGEAGAEAE